MLATLSNRRWAGALTLAILFAVVAVLLGNWQLSRHQDRVERRDVAQQNYDAPPVAVGEVLESPQDNLDAEQEWTTVRARGRYLVDDQLLVRNRPYRGVYGYEVLVPFVVQSGASDLDPAGPDGPTLIVNRGWVRNAENAATLPRVPEPPSGVVEVTGRLRSPEEDLQRDLPSGQVASINVAAVEEAIGQPTLRSYLELDSESPAPPRRPAAADAPDLGAGVHLAYALQWWLTAPVGLVLVLVMARREHREAVTALQGAPPRPRMAKRRIWDEEDV